MTESIVLQVCREFDVSPSDFFNASKRDRDLVRVRRYAIARLAGAGFNMAAIARMIRRNYSTVRYWMKPEIREYSNRKSRDYWVVNPKPTTRAGRLARSQEARP